MKIAFISQPLDAVIPPKQNSIGIWIYQVASRLSKDHEVSVYAISRQPYISSKRENGVRFCFIKSPSNRILRKLSQLYKRLSTVKKPFFASGLFHLQYSLRVALDLRKEKYDIVHIHNFSQFVPVIKAFNPQVKIILHMHCEWLTQLDQKMIQSRLRNVHMIIGCSNYITQKIKHRYPFFSDRCQTVPNGVETDRFTQKPNSSNHAQMNGREKRILFVGRVSPEKGVHTLLTAFQEVAVRMPNTELQIVGALTMAPYEFIVALSDDDKVVELASFFQGEKYIDYLRKHIPPHLSERVTFTGSISHSKIQDYYHQADILVNPSFSEAFGMSLIEAMASGVPVIATSTGGMVDIIQDGKTGLLVAPGDADAIAEAILLLFSDSSFRSTITSTAKQQVLKRYSWDSVANILLDQYQNILSKSI